MVPREWHLFYVKARLLKLRFHGNFASAHGQTLLVPSDSTVHLNFNTHSVGSRERQGLRQPLREIFEKKNRILTKKICLKTHFSRDFSPFFTVLVASRYRYGTKK